MLNGGDKVWAVVHFTEPVVVSGAPILKLRVGTEVVDAIYDPVNSSGPQAWFALTITTGLNDINGISIPGGTIVLPEGSSIKDKGGNVANLIYNSVADNGSFKVDTTITKPTFGPASIGNNDRIVSVEEVDQKVSGTAEGGDEVVISFDGQLLGKETVGSNGTWEFQLTQERLAIIGLGANKQLSAEARDAAGNRSESVKSNVFSVHTSEPPPPIITEAGGGNSIIDNLAGDAWVSGTALPGTKIRIDVQGPQRPTGTAPSITAPSIIREPQVDSLGLRSYQFTKADLDLLNTKEGDQIQIQAIATDPLNQESQPSEQYEVGIDLARPMITSTRIYRIQDGEFSSGTVAANENVYIEMVLSEPVSVIENPTVQLMADRSLLSATFIPSQPSTDRVYFSYLNTTNTPIDLATLKLAPNPVKLTANASIRDSLTRDLQPTNLDYRDETYSNTTAGFDRITGLVLDGETGDRLEIDVVGSMTAMMVSTNLSGISAADTITELNQLFNSTNGTAVGSKFSGKGTTALLTSNLTAVAS